MAESSSNHHSFHMNNHFQYHDNKEEQLKFEEQLILNLGEHTLYPLPTEVISSFPFVTDAERAMLKSMEQRINGFGLYQQEYQSNPPLTSRNEGLPDSRRSTNTYDHKPCKRIKEEEEEILSYSKTTNTQNIDKERKKSSPECSHDSLSPRRTTSRLSNRLRPPQIDETESNEINSNKNSQIFDQRRDTSLFLSHMNYLSLERTQKSVSRSHHKLIKPSANENYDMYETQQIPSDRESSIYTECESNLHHEVNETPMRRAVSDTIHNGPRLCQNEFSSQKSTYDMGSAPNDAMFDRLRIIQPSKRGVVDSGGTIFNSNKPQHDSLLSGKKTTNDGDLPKEIVYNDPIKQTLIKSGLHSGKDISLKLHRSTSEYIDNHKSRKIRTSKYFTSTNTINSRGGDSRSKKKKNINMSWMWQGVERLRFI